MSAGPHLVLAGGGHAHIEVLRRIAEKRSAGTKVTVVSSDAASTYSGMVPGLIAGHYEWRDCHIDLASLCEQAGAELVVARLTALDADAKRLQLDDGRRLTWDILSLNTGSAVDRSAIPGALQLGVAVKPMRDFLEAWQEQLRRIPEAIAIVGGGAAGTEIALAMRYRLAKLGCRSSISLITDRFLAGYPPRLRSIVARRLSEHDIALHEGRIVRAVEGPELRLDDGASVRASFCVWSTGAAAPVWLKEARELTHDERGFLLVDATLRSVSHPHILAAGDVASLTGCDVPKAGVFAVRQAPVLAENLERLLCGSKSLRPYVPQRRFLSILALGERRAVAAWGKWAAEGRWVWRWKNSIDRKFMARYPRPE